VSAYPRIRLEGCVAVTQAPADAFELFTPSGERRWAAGWDPWFPAPAHDETGPGTVFVTKRDHTTTWIVAASDPPHSITYSNVSDAGRAGLVDVRCEPQPDGSTLAKVTYDLTALDEHGAAWLNDFASGYSAYLAHWQDAIRDALAR
jgi:hypothetical protein